MLDLTLDQMDELEEQLHHARGVAGMLVHIDVENATPGDIHAAAGAVRSMIDRAQAIISEAGKTGSTK